MVWAYQSVSSQQGIEKTIDKNKMPRLALIFKEVKSLTESVINAQWQAQKLPVVGGYNRVEDEPSIFKG